jgi:uncharacterized membrane protein
VRTVARLLLGLFLLVAGTAHLTFAREEFRAQVPPWVPVDVDLVVVLSGVVEVALGLALVVARRHRPLVGWVTAAFFVAVFPGNVSQWLEGRDAFGLESDQSRFVRLFFQPVLIVWALWSTSAWRTWRERRAASSPPGDGPRPALAPDLSLVTEQATRRGLVIVQATRRGTQSSVDSRAARLRALRPSSGPCPSW